jgi:predicted Zn-dependent protease
MNNDRLEVLRESNKHSKFKTSQNNSDIIYKYSRISAKLAAYTIDLDKIANYKYNKSNKELGDYIDAIKFFRAGNLKDALLHVNKLLALRPDDPYYHELKAQIYFDGGKSLSSLNEYSIASKLRHNDVLIRLGRAIVGITTSMHNNSPMIEFYNDLLFVTENDPDNLLALHYMAIYYEKIGATGKNYLNTALIAFKSGRLKDAKKMASAAMKILPKGSPDWYKASDIVDANSM